VGKKVTDDPYLDRDKRTVDVRLTCHSIDGRRFVWKNWLLGPTAGGSVFDTAVRQCVSDMVSVRQQTEYDQRENRIRERFTTAQFEVQVGHNEWAAFDPHTLEIY
jgi:hypothetical protein